MIFGFLDVPMIHKTTYVYFWIAPMTQTNSRQIPNHFQKSSFGKARVLTSDISLFLLLLSERRVSDHPEDPFCIFGNLEYGIKIFEKTWIGHLIISIKEALK